MRPNFKSAHSLTAAGLLAFGICSAVGAVDSPSAADIVSGPLYPGTSHMQGTTTVKSFTSTALILGVNGNRYLTIGTNGSSLFAGGPLPTTVAADKVLISGGTVAANAIKVNGTIYAKEVQVLANPFPDYVFDATYRLLTLEEVEAAITADHRLPGMPSAKEVEVNGMGVSAMVVKQMEKIEELTLYAIDLKKGNDRLAAENAELAQRLERIESALNLSAGK